MLVAGTVYLEHDLAQVCGRHSTWNMTWLKFVAGTVLGTGLGSSWWQAQYLEQDLAQVGGRHSTWKRTWLKLQAGTILGRGLGSSCWQAQYTWKRTWLLWWHAQYSVGERLHRQVQVRTYFLVAFCCFEKYRFSKPIYHVLYHRTLQCQLHNHQ